MTKEELFEIIEERTEALEDECYIKFAVDAYTSAILAQNPCTAQFPPLAQLYSFTEWISGRSFDWWYDDKVQLWRKDGYASRTTAELFEYYVRREFA